MYLWIGQAFEFIGVSVSASGRWEREGFLVPEFRTKGSHRRYSVQEIEEKFELSRPIRRVRAASYARVSSHDQKKDLLRQSERLRLYCEANFPSFECIEDLGSGLNYKKPGLEKLLRLIFTRRLTHLILSHKDRLLRFGSELVFDLCKHFGVEVVVIESEPNSSFEEELTRDVLELMTVFSARLYGRRSHRNRMKTAA
ncbi:MAG: IS607 family transposase [Proteobacteria bacterium]|nr:MAG: IS607 family transposase [Pseudomonadota bacterium]